MKEFKKQRGQCWTFKKVRMHVSYMGAPYKRTYQHTKNTGKEGRVRCGYCGKHVSKWKAFSTYKRFRISDPVLRKQIDKRFVSFFNRKIYACPACARHRGIVDVGKSRKSRKDE